VSVYASFPPFDTWEVLGVLSADTPSAIFRTRWPSTPSYAAAPVVRIGLSLESRDVVVNLKQVLEVKDHDRLGFARLVAQDLFRFLSSYARTSPDGEILVAPTAVLDHWMRRFEEKFTRDPTFLYRPKD
jgi:hypothetical protein